ncbi:MAG: cob(I)yrinic acid a,c-diamide adenosyltransferase [Paraprevotella sp.]|nr:cob(I)yrinic acid a,c-diamide adenosyltransferase [Paraprevotella sp.]
MDKSKVYTRTGDRGMTSLNGGLRVSKTDVRVEAYGTVDELNAHIGELITYLEREDDRVRLTRIQGDLFVIGAYLATDETRAKTKMQTVVTEEDVKWMEQAIDEAEDGLPVWRGFILPGGSRGAAVCHVCRTVCRRAERRILSLAETAEVLPEVCAYVNRLSDYLFVLSRKMLFLEGKDEILWQKR